MAVLPILRCFALTKRFSGTWRSNLQASGREIVFGEILNYVEFVRLGHSITEGTNLVVYII